MTPGIVAGIGLVAAVAAGRLASLLMPALELPVAVCAAFVAGCAYKDAVLRPHLRVLREGLRDLQAAMADAMRARPLR